MPSTLAGLLVAIYLLIPGYCYYLVRRRTVPTRPLSTAVEGAGLVVVAVVANTLTLAIYGISQTVPWVRNHSPNVVQLLSDTSGYLLESNSRLAYVTVWAVALLAVASGLTAACAYRFWPASLLARRHARLVTDESVWHKCFSQDLPDDAYVFLECYLTDGSYSAGTLVWYNTDLQDHPDRELILRPSTLLGAGGETLEHSPEALAILSAREIRQIIVTYVNKAALDNGDDSGG